MTWQDVRADDHAYPPPASAAPPIVRAFCASVTAPAMGQQERSDSSTSATAKRPMLFEAVVQNITRDEEECSWLVKGVPKPPSGYGFSRRQIEEQMNFFKYKKEGQINAANLIDCYKYTVVAVCKCCSL